MLPPGENIIERKICPLSGQEFFVTDRDLEFYDKVSPVFGGKRYLIPSPTLCPEERQRRRLSFRNERNLYTRKCYKTGQNIISVYSSDKPYVVYDQKAWWSDDWSPMAYGKNFDFCRNFFDQFGELARTIPLPNLLTVNNENSPYAQYTGESKNIYMSADVWLCRDTYYSTTIKHVENSIDMYDAEYAQFCYECAFSKNITHCSWTFRSDDCSDCSFIFNCHQCHNCLFCCGLIAKKYYVYNKEVTPEEYERIRKNVFQNQGNIIKAQISFLQLFHAGFVRESWNVNSENCIGDDLHDCKNCYQCFDAVNTQDCRYCVTAYGNKNCYDTTIYNPGSEWTIEGVCGGVNLHSSGYNYSCLDTSDAWYTWSCLNTKNIFGCSGLHSHEHHCILNKSYSVQEYETLCGKIIDHMRSTGEWGEFFPHELSPFGYNETVAQEYFPLTEEEIKKMPRFEQRNSSGWLASRSLGEGWNWYAEPVKSFEGASLTPLPISQYDEKKVGYDTAQKNIDALLAGVVKCEVTGKPFKIIRQELAFYIEHSLPIPTKHPDQRHKERMDLRNPRKLYERYCMCEECEKIARETGTFKREDFVEVESGEEKSEKGGGLIKNSTPCTIPLSPFTLQRKIVTTYAPERPAVRGSAFDKLTPGVHGREELSGSGREKVVCEECYRRLIY